MSLHDLREVELHRRADVALDHVAAAHKQWKRENRRPRAMSAREALLALQAECWIVWTVGTDLRSGRKVSEGDWQRLVMALHRIDALTGEAA